MSDPKSIFASKTLWANLVMLLAALLNAKFGIQLDADTQVQLVGGIITAVNIVLRLVTSRPVTVTGSASPAIAILLSGAAAAGLSACSGGRLSPAAQSVGRILCAFDNAGEPVLTGMVDAAIPQMAPFLTVAEALGDPFIAAKCAEIGGAPIGVAAQ